jgi:hypothetical protein
MLTKLRLLWGDLYLKNTQKQKNKEVQETRNGKKIEE